MPSPASGRGEIALSRSGERAERCGAAMSRGVRVCRLLFAKAIGNRPEAWLSPEREARFRSNPDFGHSTLQTPAGSIRLAHDPVRDDADGSHP